MTAGVGLRYRIQSFGGAPVWRRAARRYYGILLILPALAIIMPFTVWPTLHVVYYSLFQADLAHIVPVYNGLGNYQYELTNPIFQKVLRNTFLYALVTVPISIVLGFLLAVTLNKKLRGRGLFRTMLFYPTILPTIGAAAVWLFIYIPNLGLADRFFALFHIPSHNWLGDPGLVLPALIVIAVWKQSGYFMIFYLAGLQGLPAEVFEAAAIDGAVGLRRLWSLTVPLLWGTTVFVSTVALVSAFQTVDQLFLLTLGGPSNASNLLLYFVYQEGFVNFNLGRASTVTVIMLVLVLAISVTDYRYLDKRAHYEQ